MIKAIIVNDDADACEILSDYLVLKGIDVVGTGSNGKQAVELYKKYSPDVIILELKMPEFDVNYAIDEIKKINPDAKIIVISESAHYKIEKDKVAGFFLKPFDVDEIFSAIKKIMVKNSNSNS